MTEHTRTARRGDRGAPGGADDAATAGDGAATGAGAGPHVVILGGGFGGLYAARSLKRAPVRVTVIDRRNHHVFQPLLYQVATAALSPGDIAYPIRSALRHQENARVLLAEATGVDVDHKRVLLDGTDAVSYDYLIVATGATHSYFGHDDWARRAPGLKSIEDAIEIRRRVLLAYEAAERETDPVRQREWLTFVVVGAGPTGVELAGALAEIGRFTLARDFRSVDPTAVRVVLVEGMDEVLPPYVSKLRGEARAQLERIGVEVRTGALVSRIDDRGVDIGDERIDARTVLWAAGVQASPLASSLGAPLDRAGRVQVEPDLSLPGHPEVFVVGDLVAFDLGGGKPLPGVAQAAIQGGRHAADSIERRLRGESTAPFRYRDKGSLATIGRAAAVADLGWLKIGGFAAWIVWWMVHLMFLIGFRNRLVVMLQWAWSWITFHRGARLITGSYGQLPPVTYEAHPGSAVEVISPEVLHPPRPPLAPAPRDGEPGAPPASAAADQATGERERAAARADPPAATDRPADTPS